MRSEHVEQREFVSWFRKTYRPVRIFAIPNGGKRSKSEAMKFKVEGVLPGVPDLFVPEWGLWIEMKREKKSYASKDQKDWIDYLGGCGYSCFVGFGLEDAKNKTLAFLESENYPFNKTSKYS